MRSREFILGGRREEVEDPYKLAYFFQGMNWINIPPKPAVRAVTRILTHVCFLLYSAAWLYLYSAERKLLPSSFFFFFFFSGKHFAFIQAKCKINALFSLLDLGNNGVLNVIKLGITLKQGHNYCTFRWHVNTNCCVLIITN